MTIPRILAFAGSARRDSHNKRLLCIAARGAEQAGGQVTVLDLRDFPLPLFDEDLEREQEPPERATRRLRNKVSWPTSGGTSRCSAWARNWPKCCRS